MNSKYLMATIKMPVEIFDNGNTITHDNRCVIDFHPIQELPSIQNKQAFNISSLFSKIQNINEKVREKNEEEDEDGEDDDDEDEDEDGEDDDDGEETEKNENITKLFVKNDEIQSKKYRSKNSSFKNKKYKTKQLTKKVYPTMEDNDSDVDLVQSQEDPESLLEDDL
jgi:hypothetical protein